MKKIIQLGKNRGRNKLDEKFLKEISTVDHQPVDLLDS